MLRPPGPPAGLLAGSKAQKPQIPSEGLIPSQVSPPGDPTYHPLVHVSPALALQTGLQPFVNIVGCSLSWLQSLLYLGGTGEGQVGTVYCEGRALTALLFPQEQESLFSSLLDLPWPAGNDTTRSLTAVPACQPLY